jgi:hypothetical protein
VRLQAARHGVHRVVHAVDHDDEARSLRRAAVAAIVSVSALTHAGSSLAAYNPDLHVLQWNRSLGGSAHIAVYLSFGAGYVRDNDATGVITLYSPRGYGVNLRQAPGTRLGWASALIYVPSLGNHQSVSGSVTTEDPAKHLTDACAPGRHEAVWLLAFTTGGLRFRLPVYVDRVTSGPEAAHASARMLVCLASPYVPPPQGAEAGMTLIAAEFLVSRVFTNPRHPGKFAWNGLFTPYKPGTGELNPALTTQSTAYMRLPVVFTLTGKRQRLGKRTFAIITACVREAGRALQGIRVEILVRRPYFGFVRVASRRTNARGCATLRIRVWKPGRAFAAFNLPRRQASACAPRLAAICSKASVGAALGPLRVFRLKP